MKECCWDDCLDSGNSVKVTPDKEKAKSLSETAEERIAQSAKELSEKNANFVFEDYYSSVIEVIHSIAVLDGYKIGNHVCLGYYLKDVLKREDLFMVFDDLRYKRNALTYYGRRMDFETARQAIEKAKRLIRELGEARKGFEAGFSKAK